MKPTLEWVGDTFEEKSCCSGMRSKYVHSVGNVAKIVIKPIANNQGYTG